MSHYPPFPLHQNHKSFLLPFVSSQKKCRQFNSAVQSIHVPTLKHLSNSDLFKLSTSCALKYVLGNSLILLRIVTQNYLFCFAFLAEINFIVANSLNYNSNSITACLGHHIEINWLSFHFGIGLMIFKTIHIILIKISCDSKVKF